LVSRLEPVYGKDAANAAGRLHELVEEYAETFLCEGEEETLLFSTPGRTELGGNHTDHQHGHGLAASVNLDTIACVVPNGSRTIRIKSRHHRLAEVDLDDLSVHREEVGNSVALVRGVAARMGQLGYRVEGFDAYTTTRVLRGSGLSSSAAFEVLAATIMNHLYCGDAFSPVELAQIGQFAENAYFEKPCGLLDQLSCAAGGIIAADLHDPENPVFRTVNVDLQSFGYALCVIDSRASHADLTVDYAAIPQEMGQVAACFGREVLGDVDYQQFRANLSTVRSTCGDRATLRALHFFWDDARVEQSRDALERGDFQEFLHLVRQSGRSSYMYLQNVSNYRESRSQPLALLLAVAEELLGSRGACRVHGGGFAGTIQAFVPLDLLEEFTQAMEELTGPGACHVLSFRSVGTTLLIS
jgi:galactokinase